MNTVSLKFSLNDILLGGYSGLSNDGLLNNNFTANMFSANPQGIETIGGLMLGGKKRGIWRSGVDFNDPDVHLNWFNTVFDRGTPAEYPKRNMLIVDDPNSVWYNELFQPVIWSRNIEKGRVDLDAVDHLITGIAHRPDLFNADARDAAKIIQEIGQTIESL